jgi:hypothetical protein
MSTLTGIWSQVDKLLQDGLSLIPVRDKEEQTKFGDTMLAKTPYKSWREFQSRIIGKDELWAQMEERNTTAVAIVCGKVSGNLEVIDVDVKFKPGIDTTILQDIRAFYPTLFSRLRIHKTPSTGLHIIYRVDGHEVAGNLKLAGRYASEAEIELQVSKGVKRPNKEINFLETRGEGGYILAPPSLGYAVEIDNTIPVITWEERMALITLCESYTEIIKEVPKPKLGKSQESIYSENPFEHYNNDVDPVELLQSFGWKYSHKNAKFLWFTRPDKDKGVSASWNLTTRMYYVFTTSTELQGNKGYHPATLLAELKFQGNKSETYFHLVNHGYGKVKPSIEEKLVKRAASAGKPIPANFSQSAQSTYQSTVEQLAQEHPFGLFWFRDENDKMKIDREGLYAVAAGMGFRFNAGDVIQIQGQFVHKCTARQFFDAIKAYINDPDENEQKDICNAYESFIQTSGKFTIERIELFDGAEIMVDTADSAFKFYSNGFVEITDSITNFNSYEVIPDKLIWHHKVMARPWQESRPDGSLYEQYLVNATGLNDYVKKIIGYLSHDFKSESAGYIVVLTEQVPDPKDGGGSGKNVFGNMLRNTTTVSTVPGSMVQFNEKFFQPWNGQRVYFLADIPKKIDWLFLKEMATGNGLLKKLYKDEQEIDSKDMCKLLLNTNYSFEDADGGLKRRIIPIEFTNFYTINGGIDNVHGKMFPDDFSLEDWAGYDHLIAECIQLLLKDKGKLVAAELTLTGWEKKFKGQFGDSTYEFIQDNIENWKFKGFVSNKDFTDLYHGFCTENDINQKFKAGQKLMNMAIKEYCRKHDIEFHGSYLKKQNSVVSRGKLFGAMSNEEVSTEGINNYSPNIDDCDIPF